MTALLEGLDERALLTLLYDWTGAWARDSQLMPRGESWSTWVILAGRGFGKTRCGAETTRYLVETNRAKRIALIAPTSADARDTMVEGESGLLAVCPPYWNKPKYEPSKRRVTWPNGARATLFSAEEPERLRGPQHDALWGDEPASWVDDGSAWDQSAMGLRLGTRPVAIITGTPKPCPLVLKLVNDPKTIVTKGSTFENAGNLAAGFIEQVRRLYSGTRLGRQELEAEILTDVAGALFSMEHIENNRVQAAPDLERVVISIDPAPTSLSGSDETGIVAVGRNYEGHGYVLNDHSLRGSPDEWAREAIKAFHLHKADMIIAETNNGGEMVEAVLRSVDPDVPFKAVRAMRGKAKRAEPVAALFEQGKVHLVGKHERLEKQMRVFTGINGRRDDRTDAMCWGLHELIITGSGFAFV
ncbi:MAG: hypothetical protein AMXMBFR56_72380 [Polyangiaceae bacterium]